MKKKMILLLILVFGTTFTSFADNDDYFDWNWKDDRIELQVMVGSTVYSSDVHQVYQSWNHISFVNITDISTGTNFWSSPDADIYVYDEVLGGRTYARATIFSDIGSGQYQELSTLSSSQDVGKVTIRIDPNNNIGRGTSDIRRTITHEFGHALGLAHPKENDRCVMQQSGSGYATYSINDHDKFNLMSKWSLGRY